MLRSAVVGRIYYVSTFLRGRIHSPPAYRRPRVLAPPRTHWGRSVHIVYKATINLCGLVIVDHPAIIEDELVRDLVFPWNEDRGFETIGLAGEAKRHSHDGTWTNLNVSFYSTEVLLPSTSLDMFQAVGRCRIICEHLRYCHEIRPRCSSVQAPMAKVFWRLLKRYSR
jgi:hypothetical protein